MGSYAHKANPRRVRNGRAGKHPYPWCGGMKPSTTIKKDLNSPATLCMRAAPSRVLSFRDFWRISVCSAGFFLFSSG